MRRPATVLAYHAVGTPPPGEDRHSLFLSLATFEKQMAQLAAHAEVVSLADAVATTHQGRRPRVALTFDDGYRHLLDTALPVLERHGFPATVFVPTRWIGDRNTWDPPSACDVRIMDEDELRTADRRGLRVESHGHAHIDMTAASPEDVREDLTLSRQRLQQVLGRPPRFLAWPFRNGSPAAQETAAEVGFEAAFSIDLPHDGLYSFERVQVTKLDNRATFAVKTSGRYFGIRHSAAFERSYRLAKRLRA